jgi:hypothetical protein
MYQKTGWPVVAHARAWAEQNVYAGYNGGKYPFARSANIPAYHNETIALPLTSQFWDDLFQNGREWGLLQYQQDWMYTQASMDTITTSATAGRDWRMQMTNSLELHGLRFGFGGVMPADWLMSANQQAVTNGRVSNDYHADLNGEGYLNWDIGVASVFCWALSVIPAKDGWWSTPVQPGHPYKDNRTEPYGALHTAVATLSRGPVSPADKIGLFNRTMLMRTCMDDGTLLQPDIPATAIDSQLVQMALGPAQARAKGPEGGVWATYTDIAVGADGISRYGHVLVARLKLAYSLTIAELHHNIQSTAMGPHFVVENGVGATAEVALFSAAAPLQLQPCDQADFKLYHTVPVLSNGWGYVGELGKLVPVSAARVRSIEVVDDSVHVRLSGVASEQIQVAFARAAASSGRAELAAAGGVKATMVMVSCVFGQSGVVVATPDGGCAAAW